MTFDEWLEFSNVENVDIPLKDKLYSVWCAAITQKFNPLTDEEITEAEDQARKEYRRWASTPKGQIIWPQDNYEWHLTRALEQAIRTKNL